MAVSQSNTMWVKKGTVVNGKKVKKGYVAQKGKPEKRVTNKIKLVVDTGKRGKAGDTVETKKGRYVKKTTRKKTKLKQSRSGKATTTKPPEKDTPTKDTNKNGSKITGDRKATSATVSSATKPKPARKPGLGGENKKYTPGREEPGQTKGTAKPKTRLDRIGERGPHGTAADAARAAGKGVSRFMEKYGPNGTAFDNGKPKQVIKIGTIVTRGNPPKKYRRTKNGWVLVKPRSK